MRANGYPDGLQGELLGMGEPDSEEEDNGLGEGHGVSTLGVQDSEGTPHPICPHLTQLNTI